MSRPSEEIARGLGIGVAVATGAYVGVHLVRYLWNKYQNWNGPTSDTVSQPVDENKKAWEDLAAAVKMTEGRIAELNKWGATEASGYKAELDELKLKGSEAQKKYLEAKDEFGPFWKKVEKTHTARGLMREHDRAMQEMKPLLEIAGAPEPGRHAALKTLVQEFAALQESVPETATDVATAGELAGQRKKLEDKAQELVTECHRRNNPAENPGAIKWVEEKERMVEGRQQMREHDRAMQEMKPLLEIAAGVPVPTDEPLTTLVREFAALKVDVPERSTDIATADKLAGKRIDLEAKAQAVIDEYGKAKANPTETYNNWLKEKELKETARRQILEHNYAMQQMKPLLGLVAGVPMPTTDGLLKTLVQEFAALKVDILETAEAAKTDELAGKRKDLEAKAQAVIEEYKKAGKATDKTYTDWLKEKVLNETDKQTIIRTKISVVPNRTDEIVKLKEKMAVAKEKIDKVYVKEKDAPTPNDCVEGEKALEEYFATAQEIFNLRDSVNKDEASFFKKYRPIQKRIEKADDIVQKASMPLGTDHEAFDKAYKQFEADRRSAKFKECLDALDDLKNKTNKVLEPGQLIAENKVNDVLNMPEVNPVNKKAKATAAAKAIEELDAVELEAMDPALKMNLLKALRVVRMQKLDARPKQPDDPRRIAQKKVYLAMNLDETFLEQEKAKRKELVENLAKSPLIQKAQKDWKIMTDKQREEVFREVADKQSKAFGFEPPPGGFQLGDFGEESEGNNGAFSSDNKKITLNSRATCISDFELALDLIVHENTHNYQNQLIARLDPSYTPEEDRIEKNGRNKELFMQAMMFLCNEDKASTMSDGVDPAYVTGKEDPKVYLKQPQEEHAWRAGPKTAHALVKALNKATSK